jgi:hypothetical protein
MPGSKVAYRANKREFILSAVSLRPCEPLAVIPVNGQKPEIGGQLLDRKKCCSMRPWGRRAVTLVSESCLLVVYLGHSVSVLRDSAVYSRK